MYVISAGSKLEAIEPHLDRCDVLLVNLRMPGSAALRLVRAATESSVPTRVIVRAGRVTTQDLVPYFELGVRGYLDADASIEELLHAIRIVHDGNAIIPPQISAMLISRLSQLSQVSRTVLPNGSEPLPGLTPRQSEVLGLVAKGMSNQEIADQLFIEVGTVKNHIHNLLDKLNARDRHEAAMIATRTGLLTPFSPAAMNSNSKKELLTTAV